MALVNIGKVPKPSLYGIASSWCLCRYSFILPFIQSSIHDSSYFFIISTSPQDRLGWSLSLCWRVTVTFLTKWGVRPSLLAYFAAYSWFFGDWFGRGSSTNLLFPWNFPLVESVYFVLHVPLILRIFKEGCYHQWWCHTSPFFKAALKYLCITRVLQQQA